MTPTKKLTGNDIRVIKFDSLSRYNIAEPQYRHFLKILFFEHGHGTHEIDFQVFQVEPKSIHIISPGRIHSLKRDLNSGGFIVMVNPNLFEPGEAIFTFVQNLNVYDIADFEPLFFFSAEEQNELLKVMDTLWAKYQSQSNDDQIVQLIRQVLNHCIKRDDSFSYQQSAVPDEYLRFRQKLQDHFRSIRRVNDYAELMELTPRKLNEIVTHRSGSSVSKLVQKRVTLEAKRLIRFGFTFEKITAELQFDSMDQFRRYFKKHTGLSPKEFLLMGQSYH